MTNTAQAGPGPACGRPEQFGVENLPPTTLAEQMPWPLVRALARTGEAMTLAPAGAGLETAGETGDFA